MPSATREEFIERVGRSLADRSWAADGVLAAPVGIRLLSDQLTPVLAYRRLVAPDERTAPSFLFESVESGRQSRYSLLGARPALRVTARGMAVRAELEAGTPDPSGALRRMVEGSNEREGADPADVMRNVSGRVRLARSGPRGAWDLPDAPLGGWFGYAGYDAVRYAEPGKLPFEAAPPDDRGLLDFAFHFYTGTVVFDHVQKLVHVVELALVEATNPDAGAAYDRALEAVERRADALQRHVKPLPAGRVGPERERVAESGTRAETAAEGDTDESGRALARGTATGVYRASVERALEYIRAGDVFQVVLGQRFERGSRADPFDVYRALRAVNPSPYMAYLQCPGCILIASSPEILCRVTREQETGALTVVNRPLAGTRRRGITEAEDAALESELLADEKERAEHVMLVDLARNDDGVVARPGTVAVPKLMEVERYSHVMHISSTVTGEIRGGLDAWDALRAALPVGTISGAPKVRAMQIIDELEPVRRGPYGGGLGYVGLDGQMDIALTLRTMVVPTAMRHATGEWTYHLQAGAGVVADSAPEREDAECRSKARALARAIDVAEEAFGVSE